MKRKRSPGRKSALTPENRQKACLIWFRATIREMYEEDPEVRRRFEEWKARRQRADAPTATNETRVAPVQSP